MTASSPEVVVRSFDRFAWVDRALARAAEQVDPGLARLLRHQEQRANVALVGETQVGKTTLLLLLLGVREDSLDRIAGVLRGGRRAGESATAIPTRYTVSPDEQWHIDLGTTPGLSEWVVGDDEVAAAELSRMRQRCAERQAMPERIVDVRIPRSVFTDVEPSLVPSILDMPGLHAAAGWERQAVDRIAWTLLPGIDVIVLAAPVNRMSTLQARHCHPSVSNWFRLMSRYRIVLTHAYSDASTTEQLHRGCAAPEILRELWAELTGEAPGPTINQNHHVVGRVFALEYGDSWRRFEHSDLEAWRAARSMQEEQLAALRSSLHVESVARDARRSRVESVALVVHEAEAIVQGARGELAALHELGTRNEELRGHAREQRDRAKSRGRKVTDALAALERVQIPRTQKVRRGGVRDCSSAHKMRSELRHKWAEWVRSIPQQVERQARVATGIWPTHSPPGPAFPREMTQRWIGLLKGSTAWECAGDDFGGSVLLLIDSNRVRYSEWPARLDAAWWSSVDSVRADAEGVVDEWRVGVHGQLERALAREQGHLRLGQAIMDLLGARARRLARRKAEVHGELEDAERQLSEARDVADRWEFLLTEEYLRQALELAREADETSDPRTRVLSALTSMACRLEGEAMIKEVFGVR